MILVKRDGASFWIDSTEVTKAQYGCFLSDPEDAASKAPSACAWNTTFTPVYDWPSKSTWPSPDKEDHPVNNIDWCDAWSFCHWAGKRLCGALDGGPSTGIKDSEWYLACVGDGGAEYPYGATYGALTCNGCDNQGCQGGYNLTVPVATMPGCVGGVPGLFDMTGNVQEFEDSCIGDGGRGDQCRVRGGAWSDQAAQLTCSYERRERRDVISGSAGIRCCSDDPR